MNKGIILTGFLFSVLIASPASVFAGIPAPVEVVLGPSGQSPQIPIDLVQLNLVSTVPILVPLGFDPTGANNGYGFVDSMIRVSLSSSSPSLGSIQLKIDPPGPSGPTLINHGQDFVVDSFFDVFYDITFTDIDPLRDFVGVSDGESLVFPNNQVRLSLSGEHCDAQLDQTLLGCLPQLSNKLFVGNLPLAIPVNEDINGDGILDIIQINLQQLGLETVVAIDFTAPDGPYSVAFDSFYDISNAEVNPSFVANLDDGPPVIILVPVPGALPPLPPFVPDDEIIGGEIISINSAALLVAGIQANYSILMTLALAGSGLFGAFLYSKKK